LGDRLIQKFWDGFPVELLGNHPKEELLMDTDVTITISINSEGKASIAFNNSEASSPSLMEPLDPEALIDLAARTPLEVDKIPEPASPTELSISSAPEADIAPKFHDMDELPSLSRPATDVIPEPFLLEEFTPGTELTSEYPQMEDMEFMMVPTTTGETPEPPHLGDPTTVAPPLNDIPEPMLPEEFPDPNNDPELQ
jgi:hypothetical protein